MPTANRPLLVAASIRLFLAQTYPDKELVILDDGAEPSAYAAGSYPPRGVHYFWDKPGRTLGEKHNRLVELSRGDLVAHWPDDDWFAPWRLAYQVGVMEQFGLDMVAPGETLWMDAENGHAWHVRPGGAFYNPAMLMYRKGIWARCPYEDVMTGEDFGFSNNQRKRGLRFETLPDYRFVVQRIHRNNLCSNEQMNNAWATPFDAVRSIIGSDWDAYFGGGQGLPKI